MNTKAEIEAQVKQAFRVVEQYDHARIAVIEAQERANNLVLELFGVKPGTLVLWRDKTYQVVSNTSYELMPFARPWLKGVLVKDGKIHKQKRNLYDEWEFADPADEKRLVRVLKAVARERKKRNR